MLVTNVTFVRDLNPSPIWAGWPVLSQWSVNRWSVLTQSGSRPKFSLVNNALPGLTVQRDRSVSLVPKKRHRKFSKDYNGHVKIFSTAALLMQGHRCVLKEEVLSGADLMSGEIVASGVQFVPVEKGSHNFFLDSWLRYLYCRIKSLSRCHPYPRLTWPLGSH